MRISVAFAGVLSVLAGACASEPRPGQVYHASPAEQRPYLHWTHVIVVSSVAADEPESSTRSIRMMMETLRPRSGGREEVVGLSASEVFANNDGEFTLPLTTNGAVIRFENGAPVYEANGETIPFRALSDPPSGVNAAGQGWILSQPNEQCSVPERQAVYERAAWWEPPYHTASSQQSGDGSIARTRVLVSPGQ